METRGAWSFDLFHYHAAMPLLAVAMDQPLFWAVVIGWVLSVTLHEFAHGLVGHLGGDYTIKERGGLTLNPLQYIDPVFSIVVPTILLLLGGIPLPGGVTYIRNDLLRSRAWETAVSLAGPAMNFLIFLALALPLHPSAGWVDPRAIVPQWTTAQIFCAALAFLQLFSVILNLIPIPPLDGFQAIAPYLNPETRQKLTTPPTSTFLFIGFFVLLFTVPRITTVIVWKIMDPIISAIGVDTNALINAYNVALRGSM